MTQHDVDVVRRKLAIVQQAVLALESLGTVTLDGYRADLWQRKATERFLQEGIEAALDCASHLVVRAGRPAPADPYSTFLAAAEVGVLDAAFARRLAPAAGLRDRLVHEYDDLDDETVFAALPRAAEDLARFVAEVERYLRRGP